MIGDGEDVGKINVDVELLYHLTELTDRYYSDAFYKAIGLNFPQFFVDVGKDILKSLTPAIQNTVSFANGVSQLTNIMNHDQIPTYKLNLYNKPKS